MIKIYVKQVMIVDKVLEIVCSEQSLWLDFYIGLSQKKISSNK